VFEEGRRKKEEGRRKKEEKTHTLQRVQGMKKRRRKKIFLERFLTLIFIRSVMGAHSPYIVFCRGNPPWLPIPRIIM
jgi:hypothetical protein